MPYLASILSAFEAKQIRVKNPPTEDFITTKWLQIVKAQCQCLSCGHEWETAFDNITRKSASSGCPQCAQRQRAQNMLLDGQQKVDARLKELRYTRVGPYGGHFKPVEMRCSNGHEFSFAPVNLGEQRCPECSGTSQHISLDDAVRLYTAGTTWTYEEGVFTCSCCGARKQISLDRIKTSARRKPLAVRMCGCQRYGKRYLQAIAEAPGYEAVEPYSGMKTPVLVRHSACGTEWRCAPGNFIKGTRCPTCARTGRASDGQRRLADFVRSLGVSVEENVSGLDPMLPRTEVDIFLPEHGVAIEFDGVWWHAEGPSRDHAGRSRPSAQPDAIVARLERLRARGIYLLRVFSDEWIHERAMIETAIRAAVGQGEQTLDLTAPVLWLDRRLATRFDEETLQNAGYRAIAVVPPVCQYVHPSASNRRVHFDSDDEAISQGYSRVWGSGYIEYHRN